MNKITKFCIFALSIIFSIILAELILGVFISNSKFCQEYVNSELRELGEEYAYSNIPNLFFIPNLETEKYSLLKHKIQDYSQNKNITRIFIIGDSITAEEEYVEYDRNNLYSEILASKLNQGSNNSYEVWNLGVRKYNTFQEYLYFNNYFLKFNPEIVIVGYGEFNDYAPPRLNYDPNLSPTQNCIVSTIPNLVGFNDNLHKLFSYSNLYNSLNLALYNILNKIYPIKYPDIFFKNTDFVELNRKALLDLIELSKKEDFKLIIIIFPVLEEDYDRDMWLFQTLDKDKYIDTYPYLKNKFENLENARSLLIENDPFHLNKEAHLVIAELLYDKIMDIKKIKE